MTDLGQSFPVRGYVLVLYVQICTFTGTLAGYRPVDLLILILPVVRVLPVLPVLPVLQYRYYRCTDSTGTTGSTGSTGSGICLAHACIRPTEEFCHAEEHIYVHFLTTRAQNPKVYLLLLARSS